MLFDSIVLAEGEESIIEAIEDVLECRLKLLYKQRKAIDLNLFPYPLREYLPREAIVDTGLLAGKYLNLKGTTALFSKGCPFNCYFCANRKLTYGPVRYRSPKNVFKEIEYLKREYQIEALAIKDDNAIALDRRIAGLFLEAIGKAGIKWRGQSRANSIHPDMVRLAKEAGCVDIALGIESVSQEQLKFINKNMNLAEAKDYIELLHKTGINVRLHFIIGLPYEPNDVVKQTLDFIDKTKPASVLLSLFCPMPGSEIYSHPKRFGIKIKTRDWKRYRTAFGRFDVSEIPDIVFECEGKSRDKILSDYMQLQDILRERKLNF